MEPLGFPKHHLRRQRRAWLCGVIQDFSGHSTSAPEFPGGPGSPSAAPHPVLTAPRTISLFSSHASLLLSLFLLPDRLQKQFNYLSRASKSSPDLGPIEVAQNSKLQEGETEITKRLTLLSSFTLEGEGIKS